jgi:hypothetical protein
MLCTLSVRSFSRFEGRLCCTLVALIGAIASHGQPAWEALDYTSTWRFVDTSVVPNGWTAPTFDDSALPWQTGAGVFAFPRHVLMPRVLGGVNTELWWSSSGDGHPTHYFRSSITLTSSPTDYFITGAVAADDGAVVYVNGHEVARIGMPNGPVDYGTSASRTIAFADILEFGIAPSNFVFGVNVIAVELHQTHSVFDKDAVFAMQLVLEKRVPLRIASQSTSRTAVEGSGVVFSVEVEGTKPWYQWYTNNIAIPGATAREYQIPAATLAMDGLTYHVVVSDFLQSVTSAPMELTVLADTFGPQVRSVIPDGGFLHRLIIEFDEPVLESSTTNAASYSLRILGTTDTIPITNVNYTATRVRVWVDHLLDPKADYLLRVADAADTKTNVLFPNPLWVPVGYSGVSNLVSMGETWRFNDSELDQIDSDWKTLAYDDDPTTPPHHWNEARAAFAYPQRSEVGPCFAPGTTLAGGTTTSYFRKRFVVSRDYGANSRLILRYLIDDGAVFYLNGQEIHRRNLPEGSIDHWTRALGSVIQVECRWLYVPISLVIGTNILAVELHQANLANEPRDAIFDAELILHFVRTPEMPPLRVTQLDGQAALTWDSDGWRLQAATNPSGPWSAVADNTNRFVLSPATAPEQRFFRLVAP